MPYSIIIPAHNERDVIRRCLSAITADAREGEFEIIVVCNGCTDNTAALAAGHDYPVAVIDTPVPSKANALNLGDAAAKHFPRFYVDADVLMSTGAVRKVGELLLEGRVHAAAPAMRVNLTGRNWFVRAYFDIWNLLPYCRDAMVGSGVYALSEIGRERFKDFPETKPLIADDNFVRMHFARSERASVEGCWFETTPPRTLSGVVKIKARAHIADRRLRKLYPDLYLRGSNEHGLPLLKLAMDPWLWPKLSVYIYLRLMVRIRSVMKQRFGQIKRWERDESAREEHAPVGA